MDPYTGEIRIFAGNYAPVYWALCQGQLLNISSYDALYSLLGTRYGGNGTTTFGLPDMRGRAPIHYGHGSGLQSYSLGQMGGAAMVGLTPDQIGDHSHFVNTTTNDADATLATDKVLAKSAVKLYGGGLFNHDFDATAVANSGGGETHGNMAPFLALTFIICVNGQYPPRN